MNNCTFGAALLFALALCLLHPGTSLGAWSEGKPQPGKHAWQTLKEMLKKDEELQRQRERQNETDERNGEIWAVLVAGSNAWYNYRHQADVCHSYQILHQHGVPDDHIIVMMYDDIANNTENPTPGVIINRPGGPNVYKGVPHDYTGEEVTPQNFLKVLQGDAEGLKGVGSGKVLKSGPSDRIFINMVDHGAPGIFGFPDDYLSAIDLEAAIVFMHLFQKYKEMVIYVESCESGSLFQGILPRNIGVYAVSAASPDEPSFACYFDDDLDTFVGDVFSVKWMEDTDRENLQRETLKDQFWLVRYEVSTSRVMHWGETKLDRETLSRFMGSRNPRIFHHEDGLSEEDPCLDSAVATPDVPIALLKARIRATKKGKAKDLLKEKLTVLRAKRHWMEEVMKQLVLTVTGHNTQQAETFLSKSGHYNITQWKCYLDSVDAFHRHCFHLSRNTYGLRLLPTLIRLCEDGFSADEFLNAAETLCNHSPVTGIH